MKSSIFSFVNVVPLAESLESDHERQDKAGFRISNWQNAILLLRVLEDPVCADKPVLVPLAPCAREEEATLLATTADPVERGKRSETEVPLRLPQIGVEDDDLSVVTSHNGGFDLRSSLIVETILIERRRLRGRRPAPRAAGSDPEE